MGCFALVTTKGTFMSYKGLYAVNLKQLAAEGQNKGLDVLAYRETIKDVQEGTLLFDGKGCIGCGTCAEIGPREMVQLEPGEPGRGVRFRYG